VPHRLRLVVTPLHPLAVDQHAAAGEPADQLLLLDHQLEDPVEVLLAGGEGVTELLGLGDGPREPVQQEAVHRVGLGQPPRHHGHRDLVGHQVAGVHVDLGLQAELGLAAHVGPKDVAGGDGRHPEPVRDDLGLGPLAGSGRAQQHDAHQRRNPS
jgi:hypothetical protein